jgi:predicted RNA binding protein YcfA (HicA-like mRNA interferase family)
LKQKRNDAEREWEIASCSKKLFETPRACEMKRLAGAFGFRLGRISGSHHIYVRTGVPQLVNLQNYGGKAKPQVKQMLKLAELHNLRLED